MLGSGILQDDSALFLLGPKGACRTEQWVAALPAHRQNVTEGTSSSWQLFLLAHLAAQGLWAARKAQSAPKLPQRRGSKV